MQDISRVIDVNRRKEIIRSYYGLTVEQLKLILPYSCDRMAISAVIHDRATVGHNCTTPDAVLLTDEYLPFHPGDSLMLDSWQKFQRQCTLLHYGYLEGYSDVMTKDGQQLWVANYRLERKFKVYNKKKDF